MPDSRELGDASRVTGDSTMLVVPVARRAPAPVHPTPEIATLDPETQSPLELFRRADERLYEAKNAGRNCVAS